jgi:hypothetical protein
MGASRGKSESESGSESEDPLEALRDAAADLSAVRTRLAERDGDRDGAVDGRVESLAEAYRDVLDLLDRYEERATDWEDLEGYVRFRDDLAELIEGLPESFPHREAFERADEELKTGGPQEVLDARDFGRARERLAPAREAADLLERRRAARQRYREARSDLLARREALRERIADLERLLELGAADPDAPVERLRDPIDAYDERVRTAFATYRREAPARDLLATVAEAASFPLVGYEDPPAHLSAYLADADAGDESVATLLEYADFSRSKLDHYVADPDAFRTAVATNRTYLRELDATPLTVGWPPPPPDRLRWRARELIAVVGRFADEAVVARAREVRALARREDYADLRRSAVARADLDDAERERLADGAAERDLMAARADLERVEAALAEYPPRSDLSEPTDPGDADR